MLLPEVLSKVLSYFRKFRTTSVLAEVYFRKYDKQAVNSPKIKYVEGMLVYYQIILYTVQYFRTGNRYFRTCTNVPSKVSISGSPDTVTYESTT